VLSCRGVTLDIDAHAVTVHGKPVTLPLRQFELLKILLANAGQVVSQQQLIDLLWPRSPRDSSNGVYVHVRRLRRNLDPLCPGPSYIISVRKVGYMFASDTSSSARQAIMRHG
jgi:two-component system response regulator RegX3